MTRSPVPGEPLAARVALGAFVVAMGVFTVGCAADPSRPGVASGGKSGASSGGATGSGGVTGSGGATGGIGSTGGSASGGGPGSGASTGSGGMTASSGGAGSGGSASGGATGPASGGRVGSGGGGGPGAGGASSGGAPGAGGRSGILRIMPLGDSTTGSVCYRAYLWDLLNKAGHTGKFDLVGSNKNNSDPKGVACAPSNADPDNEGHPTCLVTEIVDNVTRSGCDTTFTALKPKLTADQADIVLMHFGTNDVWNAVGTNTEKILDADGALIDHLRTVNPNVVVLIAKIIPMNVTSATCTSCSCSACGSNIDLLNGMLTGWAGMKSTTPSPVIVVDQFTGFDATADTVDGVHPNANGSTKIATKWAAALAPYF